MKTRLNWSACDAYGAGDAYADIPATGGNYAKTALNGELRQALIGAHP